MLKNLNLKNCYTTQSSNIISEFYIPLLKEAENYDRATGYFNSSILKLYSKGLEYFQANKGKIRFIMSHEISETDFNEMNNAYNNIQQKCENEFWKEDIEDSREISNLAYLIENHIVDIRIAFMEKSEGIYHSKFGIFYDKENNVLFNGSNNETYYATNYNAERFDVVIDWSEPSQREIMKITDAKREFDSTWNNEEKGIITKTPSDAFFSRIISFSKGRLIYDFCSLKSNFVLLDFNNDKKIEIRFNSNFDKISKQDIFYKKEIKYLVKEIWANKIELIENMEIRQINELIKNMKKYSILNDFEFIVSLSVDKYIENVDLEISKRYSTGKMIKARDSGILKDFESFKLKVDELMFRKLREQQMWDAFFGLVMEKSFNFSVPGSGKTSVILAIYVFLKYKNKIKKIIMIGPLSSFKSWKDEYYMCFNKKPNVLNLNDYKNSKDKNINLKNSVYGNFDLILINYQSIDSCKESIKEILNDSFVVLDESHYIKSNIGVWSNACFDLFSDSRYMILLTGTPIPNGIADLYMQLKILYKKEYNYFFKWDYNYLQKMDDASLLNKKIYPFFCRTNKNDLSVPKANKDILKNVTMSLVEENLFKSIYKKFENANSTLEFVIRCMQASSNPKLLKRKISLEDLNSFMNIDDETNKHKIDSQISSQNFFNNLEFSSKFLKCIDFITEKTSNNKTIILWCVFIDTMNDFYNILTEKGITCKIINGSINILEREAIIAEFQNSKFAVLIANPNTIAESVSLHKNCHDAIYYEFTYNLTHLIQSKDRIHRLGLKDNEQTNYYFFCLVNNHKNFNSIDSIIYNRLKEKEKIMSEVIESKEILITPPDNNDWQDIIKTIIYK